LRARQTAETHTRQAEGIAAAKARGVRFGRPAKEAPAAFAALVARWEAKEISAKDIRAACGMSEATFYRRLREYRMSRRQRQK
jgi:DNA invertase Pin-like site-specific DNA recombinase